MCHNLRAKERGTKSSLTVLLVRWFDLFNEMEKPPSQMKGRLFHAFSWVSDYVA
jgi:hypothetical protein